MKIFSTGMAIPCSGSQKEKEDEREARVVRCNINRMASNETMTEWKDLQKDLWLALNGPEKEETKEMMVEQGSGGGGARLNNKLTSEV